MARVSVTSTLVAAGMTAARAVFEINAAWADKIEDKQSFLVPAKCRPLLHGDVDWDTLVGNYVGFMVHSDFPIVDSDNFWDKSLQIRSFMRSDARNLKGRSQLFKKSKEGGLVDKLVEKLLVRAKCAAPRLGHGE